LYLYEKMYSCRFIWYAERCLTLRMLVLAFFIHIILPLLEPDLYLYWASWNRCAFFCGYALDQCTGTFVLIALWHEIQHKNTSKIYSFESVYFIAVILNRRGLWLLQCSHICYIYITRSRNPRIWPRDPSRWPRGTLYPQKLALTSPISGSRSVGIVCSWTQATEFFFVYCNYWNIMEIG
jgi:hypothetical protein